MFRVREVPISTFRSKADCSGQVIVLPGKCWGSTQTATLLVCSHGRSKLMANADDRKSLNDLRNK
jgi:hypothetical protein